MFLNFNSNPSGTIIVEACESANNGSNCASRACAVELGFLRDWWVLQQQYIMGLLDNEVPVYKHKSAGGIFDPEVSCTTLPGLASERNCCGSYPIRFPFRVLDGSRSCCGDVTYWNNVYECCNGDILSLSC